MTTRAIRIRAKVPPGIDDAELASFVADALESWGGQFHPDDPLFDSLNIQAVTIGGIKYVKGKSS